MFVPPPTQPPQGPEPEGIALATVTVAAGQPQRRLLFLTLERTSLIAVYDLTNPTGERGLGCCGPGSGAPVGGDLGAQVAGSTAPYTAFVC
jgi:hypothetical protein